MLYTCMCNDYHVAQSEKNKEDKWKKHFYNKKWKVCRNESMETRLSHNS